MIKAVIFDLFETLITEWGHEKYTKRKISEDLHLDFELFNRYWEENESGRYLGKVSFEESILYVCKKCGVTLLPDQLAYAVTKRMSTKAACFDYIDPEVIALLKELKARGLRLAMLSNCSSEEVTAIRQSRLSSFFDTLVLSYEVGLAKPDPLIYGKVLSELHLAAEECLYIGDGGSNELEGARAAGMVAVQAIWYTNKHPDPRESMEGFITVERPLDLINKEMVPMGCSVQCQETGKCCGNGDVGLVCSWLNELMIEFQENPAILMEAAIKKCSKTHYDALNMDDILEPFLGSPEAFFSFLQEKWNWIVTVDKDGKRIIADENKSQCVCPLIRAGAVHTPNLCNCSEGFAERMFSKVLRRQVKARVIESLLRGGKHCVYEIMME